MIASLVGLPFFAVMQLHDNNGVLLCLESGWPSETFRDIYTMLSFCLTYAFPLPMIAVLYTIIVLKLNKAARETSDHEGFRTAKAKGKVIRMLIVVVVFYFLCFLPYHSTYMWYEFGDGGQFKWVSFLTFSFPQNSFLPLVMIFPKKKNVVVLVILTHPLIHWLINSLIRWFIDWFIHSFTVNSRHSGHHRDQDLVSVIEKVRNNGCNFWVIPRDFSCCP